MSQSEKYIRDGLQPSEIAKGIEIALKEIKKLLPEQVALEVKDIKDEKTIKIIESVLASKQPIYYKFFSQIVFDACRQITRDSAPRFDSDNLWVCKILGGDIEDTKVIKGFVINRTLENQKIQEIVNPKIAVYKCPF